MRVLIIFGTTEGHTRELCEFAARCLHDAGHSATVEQATAKSEDKSIVEYDAFVLAGSLHVGSYQPALIQFALNHHETLASKPNAFISVSLSAAGENPHDWEGLEQCLARFEKQTGWKPQVVHHAAGAIRYSHYDFFKRLAIKYIASRRGQDTVTSCDYDLTDYDALKTFVLKFVEDAVSQ
jgi:menaquinone-dependent protoporphyrinogen oxidase